MRWIDIRFSTALVTFIAGVWIASALALPASNPVIEPVYINTIDTVTPSATKSTLEMVFVLDTTGSMGGLLEGAKQRIWGIVNEVMQSPAHPAVRIGLVAYRDRGDRYVTQVLPLTEDLDKVYTTLMDYQADGGGDGPEDVRSALADGVGKAGWAQAGANLAQIVFLVGDAPPHDNYVDVPDTLTTAANAVKKGMIVNTIQCGTEGETTRVWKVIAQRGQGQYFAIAQGGGVETIATPYDEQLGQLASRLGGTFVAYGFGAGAEGELRRIDIASAASSVETRVAAKAPAQARAERALNKAVSSDAYVGDLLQNIENGSLKLEAVKKDDLPADLQKLEPAERQKEIEKRLAERREIRAQILSLSKQRDEFILAERKKTGVKQNGFDGAVTNALKEQMKRKGLK
jgi:Mg-chelatase subunit ChlD